MGGLAAVSEGINLRLYGSEFLKGACIGESIREYFRGYKGNIRSLDSSLYGRYGDNGKEDGSYDWKVVYILGLYGDQLSGSSQAKIPSPSIKPPIPVMSNTPSSL